MKEIKEIVANLAAPEKLQIQLEGLREPARGSAGGDP